MKGKKKGKLQIACSFVVQHTWGDGKTEGRKGVGKKKQTVGGAGRVLTPMTPTVHSAGPAPDSDISLQLCETSALFTRLGCTVYTTARL